MSPRSLRTHRYAAIHRELRDACAAGVVVQVRYIIDYYDNAAKRHLDKVPQLHDFEAVPSIEVDVRPAIDSPGAFVDRARVLAASWFATPATAAADSAAASAAAASAATLPAGAAAAAAAPAAEAGGSHSDSGGGVHARMVEAVQQGCADRMAELSACTGEREAAQAHIRLTMCIAQHVCSAEAQAFLALKGSADADQALAAQRFGEVQACVERWGREASMQASN